jgi:hypothetical protein
MSCREANHAITEVRKHFAKFSPHLGHPEHWPVIDMFPLLASWNEFAGTPMEEPLDDSIMRAAYTGYMRSKYIQKTYTSVQHSSGAEIKLPSVNGPYSFRVYSQIYRLVSPLYPNETNKLEYGQLYIFDSAVAMRGADEMLGPVNLFPESYKWNGKGKVVPVLN